ncbi:hypothetical protein WK80_22400 [Burkholderia multivorans]|uniref:hypothetical protein n=1 Tax=Burkholderia multivorans TaxID=87883 RepID=UPI00075DB385|nr:hypothetical protein [Burkholderia multivorans]KVV22341.1 hypothetical protein WK80_22400 [Burkholderia multivorans]
MSEIKHSPGPWTNHGRITGPGLPHSAVVAETLIARVFSKYFGDVEQEVANANLIAAAPDMALALEMIAAEDDAARHNGTPLLTSGVRMTLDAALIKAGRKEAPERNGD